MARKGVPIGYTHIWGYHGRWKEKKIGKGKWKVEFTATKGRSSGKGGPNKGTKIRWKFSNVKQTARKIGRGKYQTKLTAYKYLDYIKPSKKRRY